MTPRNGRGPITRRFATSAAATVLLAGFQSVPGWAQASGNIRQPADFRTTLVLDKDWRFHQGDAPANTIESGFDDSKWQAVSVPHTWNRVGFYRPDPASHIHRAETVDKTQGLGCYRQRFTVPTEMRGKSVWLNGQTLGDHAGGFSRFRLDATKTLVATGENILVVRTNNSAPGGEDATTADVLPLTGDFFVHGGLYRPVRLIAVDPIHVDLATQPPPNFCSTAVRSVRARTAWTVSACGGT